MNHFSSSVVNIRQVVFRKYFNQIYNSFSSGLVIRYLNCCIHPSLQDQWQAMNNKECISPRPGVTYSIRVMSSILTKIGSNLWPCQENSWPISSRYNAYNEPWNRRENRNLNSETRCQVRRGFLRTKSLESIIFESLHWFFSPFLKV